MNKDVSSSLRQVLPVSIALFLLGVTSLFKGCQATSVQSIVYEAKDIDQNQFPLILGPFSIKQDKQPITLEMSQIHTSYSTWSYLNGTLLDSKNEEMIDFNFELFASENYGLMSSEATIIIQKAGEYSIKMSAEFSKRYRMKPLSVKIYTHNGSSIPYYWFALFVIALAFVLPIGLVSLMSAKLSTIN